MIFSLFVLGACSTQTPQDAASPSPGGPGPAPEAAAPPPVAPPASPDADGARTDAKAESGEGEQKNAGREKDKAEGTDKSAADVDCSPAKFVTSLYPEGGDTIQLSGNLNGFGGTGMLILEVVEPSEKRSVYSYACRARATFSVAVPTDLGEVVLVALLDTDNNGPSAADSGGRAPGVLNIGTADIDGIEISLGEPSSLGDIAPPYTLPGGLSQSDGGKGEPARDSLGQVIEPGKDLGGANDPGDNPEPPVEGAPEGGEAAGEPPGENPAP